MKKYTRQRLILDIIQNNDVKTQSQLSELLKEHGINATQATISRDIKELRISKVQSDDYDYKYTVVDNDYDSFTERMEKIFKESVLSIEKSNQLIVIKSISYCATVCGAYITNAKLDNVGGIVTGIDTIFISPVDGEKIDVLVEDLRSLIK
ncbi:MAG: arginine repressor [Anaerococcus sp.]|nr:arginine repressor [Anaerococcus sp.]MDD7044663.1 arginine repressor [Peptoniphilaceae bacterium]MDY2918094.1 arginine repressor [Anaerococcus sp.]